MTTTRKPKTPDAFITGWDVAPHATGWCAGDGSAVPVAGAFRPLDGLSDPALGSDFHRYIERIHYRLPATHYVIERPLLRPTDKMSTLLRIYGMRMVLLVFAVQHGIFIHEESPADLKAQFGQKPQATKDDMIFCAEKLGIVLPATKADGKGDAADAAAAWMIGVRLFARQRLAQWDTRLYSRSRALL